jgi:hypothetical protein
MQVAARKVKAGQYVRRSTGEVIKVLCSNVEKLSGASGSATQWEITGYAEGQPTRRILSGTDDLVEVVAGP